MRLRRSQRFPASKNMAVQSARTRTAPCWRKWSLSRAVISFERLVFGSAGFCTQSSATKLKDCYFLLEVDENASLLEVRNAYLRLAKDYHPDCGKATADAGKFARIDKAYRTVLADLCGDTVKNTTTDVTDKEETQFDIEHTAPQHR